MSKMRIIAHRPGAKRPAKEAGTPKVLFRNGTYHALDGAWNVIGSHWKHKAAAAMLRDAA
jgi:hypothetical protein